MFFKKKIDFFGIDTSKNATLLTRKKLRGKIYKNRIFNEDFVNFDYKKKSGQIFQFIQDLHGILLQKKMR